MKKALVLGVFSFLMASQAEAQTMTKCEGPDARACHQQNLKAARKALDRAIMDACKKQGSKRADLLACRAELTAKAAEGIER